MSDTAVLCLFGGAVLSALLSGFLYRTRSLWTLFGAICTVCGVLTGLALGWTLDNLLAPVLIVCATAVAALLFGKGGSEE